MESLQREQMKSFHMRLRLYLAECAAERGRIVSPQQIDTLVELGMDQCRRFHLVRELDIARYLELLLRLPDMESAMLPRAALQVLLRYGVDPSRKLDGFESWLEVNYP